MAAGGEEKAVFVGLKNDAQEYLPQAAHKAAQFAEDTSHSVDQGVTAHLEGDAQLGRDMTHIGEHPPEEVPRVQSPAAPPRGRGVSSQAESDAKNLAAETDKEAQEGARLDGEGGSSEDPIDLVSGEMFLPQTDLVLPGELPLVLERRHGSAYRYGRFFGSTWSSTLDQRRPARPGRLPGDSHGEVGGGHAQVAVQAEGRRAPATERRRQAVQGAQPGRA
jgi:hypothetical protein